MAVVKVVAMFDDPALLERARSRLIKVGIATDAMMRVEPEKFSEDIHGPRPMRSVWERLKELLPGHSDEEAGQYAEGVRRGSEILVVNVPEEEVELVRRILNDSGALDMRKRVRRWFDTGWQFFDPAEVGYTEEEVQLERQCILDEGGGEDDDEDADAADRTIVLFDEATGREIGRITEGELKVLQDALEEEDPDDNDYWINPDEIDDLACRPGATRPLIRLLRKGVGDNPAGIDIAFQREGEPRQSLRGRAGAV
jgi:hypothetical protein